MSELDVSAAELVEEIPNLAVEHTLEKPSAELNAIAHRFCEIRQDQWREHEEFLRASGFSGPYMTPPGPSEADISESLRLFLDDHSNKSPEELKDMADRLSPGGAHTGGLLVRLVMANLFLPDPRLVAAVIYRNWHGGKAGFQFLPDPSETPIEDYRYEAYSLIESLEMGTDGDPRSILTGTDRDFFDSLPESFTVYRGCAGVSVEQAGQGVCWTTSRAVAEWFATRSAGFRAGSEPLLVTARVRKEWVVLAKAIEFEVVLQPPRFRALKCRRRADGWRPNMEWNPKGAGAVVP